MNELLSQDLRSRTVDWALAVVLGLAPLLPQGASYVGGAPRSYVELVLPALTFIWVLARVGRRPSARYVAVWPWDLLLAAIAGATVLGLMADNRVWSPVFAALMQRDLGDLFRPMHLASHPLHSLRVGLTFFEGWLTFRLVVAICGLAPESRRRATFALGGWLSGVAVVAVVALVQYATAMNLQAYWVRANPLLVRTNSTLDDPNTLGAVLVLAIGLLVGLLRLGDSRWRQLWFGLASLSTFGLITTMSRSALGAAVIAPLGILAIGPTPTTILQRRIRLASRIVMTVLLAAIAGSVVLREFTPEQQRTNPSGLFEMVVTTFDPRESAGWVLRGRLPWWQASAAMFDERPLVGVGLGRVPREAAAFGGGPMRENTHNLFLQLLAETGLIGFAAFAALCTAITTTLSRAVVAPSHPDNRPLALGGLIAVLGFLLTLLTGHALLLPSGQILFASFTALVLTAAATAPAGATQPRTEPASASASTEVGPQRPPQRRIIRILTWGAPASALAFAAVAAIAPAVGIAQGIAPATGAWGHHTGLHDEEPTEDHGPFRWTTDRAILDLAVPDGATSLVLNITAVYPVRDGVPTSVRVMADGDSTTFELTSSDIRELRVPAPATDERGPRRILLNVTVTPTFVPGGGDNRVLGAQIFRPRFETDASRPRE